MPVRMQNLVTLTALAIGAMVATTAHAQKKYDSGASDTEIKIGNIMLSSTALKTAICRRSTLSRDVCSRTRTLSTP